MELKIKTIDNKNDLKRVKLKKFLEQESKFIIELLTTCNIPNRIEKDDSDLYLLPLKDSQHKPLTIKDFERENKLEAKEDIDERLLKIKNKFKVPKKNNKSEKALKRKELKKLKKNKEIKKLLVSSAKAEKNEKIKTEKSQKQEYANNNTELNGDIKKDIKQLELKKNVFNETGKTLFSKVDCAPYPGAIVKKTKKEKCMKNPKDILKKIKETDKKLRELKEHGDDEKVQEVKKDLLWRKAFDKVQGKKVKDDRNLLYKSIKKKKNIKKKSKKTWEQRKEKVKKDIEARQKKREENLEKRKKVKKNRKLKRLSKKGHIIPGF